MSTTPQRNLTAQEIEHLVSLRLMLEQALRRAKSAGPYDRATATVLLDAVVERSLWLVVADSGQSISTNTNFDNLLTSATQYLAERWTPTSVPDVRQLHRARNAAQHDGLGPDPRNLQPWIGAVKKFTTSLIGAAYGVDVTAVSMSAAVRDPDLSQHMREAERALAEGDLHLASREAQAALNEAIRRWEGLSPTRRPAFTSSHFIRGTSDELKGLATRLDRLDESTKLAPFAAQQSEVAWFLQTRDEWAQNLDATDVERLLTFTFTWITSFEEAASDWVANRGLARAISRRRVRREAGPARVDNIQVEPVQSHGIGAAHKVSWMLTDVPPASEYDAWMAALSRRLRISQADPSSRLWVELDGRVTLRLDEPDSTLVAQTAGSIASALVEAESDYQEELVTQRQLRDERRALELALAEEVKLVGNRVPDWVSSIELRPPWGDRGEALRVVLDEDLLATLSESHHFTGPLKSELAVTLGQHPAIESASPTAPGSAIDVEPAFRVEVLLEALAPVDGLIKEKLAEHSRVTAARDDLKRELRSAAFRGANDVS